MTDDEIRKAITVALQRATDRPMAVEVAFNEQGDVFSRVDMKDADFHWSQNVDPKNGFTVEYHPRHEIERRLDWYCSTLAKHFTTAISA
jgi:hypothetical protein